MSRLPIALCAALLLTACGGHENRPERLDHPPSIGGGPRHPAGDVWRQLATEHDRDRMRHVRDALVAGLARAQVADPAGVAAAGALLQPDAGLENAALAPGRYRCRLYKMGANGAAARDFTVYPTGECQVQMQGSVLVFAALDGVQRPVGTLFGDSHSRGVFLGTLLLRDESVPLTYGIDAARDIAGAVERVGERRWRIVMPYPAFQSVVDVMEITPL